MIRGIGWFAFLALHLTQAAHASDNDFYSEVGVCEQIRERMADSIHLSAICQSGFQHYCHISSGRDCIGAEPESALKTSELKIGGFNVLNLGMEADFKGNRKTFFKDIPLLAQVIDHADLVAVVELKHFAKEDRKLNTALFEAVDRGEVTLEEVQEHWVVPHYLQLLQALHDLGDSSWSLILSPHLYPKNLSDTLNNELAGFFYRASKVQPQPTTYCSKMNGKRVRGPSPIACVISESEFQSPIRRKPFFATFESGDLKFTFGAFHARYRPVKLNVDFEMGSALGLVVDAFRFFGDLAQNSPWMARAQSYLDLGLKRDEIWRALEVESISKVVARMVETSREKDVVLFGDFNLPTPLSVSERKKDAYQSAWKISLSDWKNARVFIDQPTTVGKKELKNAYDHFVLNPSRRGLKGCVESGDLAVSGGFDFTDPDFFPQARDQLRDLRADMKSSLESFENRLASQKKYKKGEWKPRYSEKKIKYLSNGYRSKVLDGEGFNPYRELLSDHLPIFFVCDTQE